MNKTIKIDADKFLASPTQFGVQLKTESKCEYTNAFGKDRKGNPRTCGDMYDCCDCGTRDEDKGCGCSYCFSCNACEHCINED